jgi:hypothetical protein
MDSVRDDLLPVAQELYLLRISTVRADSA